MEIPVVLDCHGSRIVTYVSKIITTWTFHHGGSLDKSFKVKYFLRGSYGIEVCGRCWSWLV